MVSCSSEKDKKNVLVIGALGAGKSTLLSAIYHEDYDIRKECKIEAKDRIFEPSKSLQGFTQCFTQMYSSAQDCMITDSPGLGDSNIPIQAWIERFNDLVKVNERVDLVVVMVEKKARVSQVDVLTLTVLDQVIDKVTPENLVIVCNKCDADDDLEFVKNWYESCLKQADCKNLPESLSEENYLLIQRMSIGSSMKPLIDEPEKANALIKYVKIESFNSIFPLLAKVEKTVLKEAEFDKIKAATKDPMLLKFVSADQEKYEKCEKEMKEKMEKNSNELNEMRELNRQRIVQSTPQDMGGQLMNKMGELAGNALFKVADKVTDAVIAKVINTISPI